MRRGSWLWLCALAALALARPAIGETVVEAWRGGGFYTPSSVSVNPSDGSCWVADSDNNQVVHLSAAGTQLWRGGGFYHAALRQHEPNGGLVLGGRQPQQPGVVSPVGAGHDSRREGGYED